MQIIEVFGQVQQIYTNRGFKIIDIHGDNEFNLTKLRESVKPETLNLCVKNEHIQIIEKSICTLKEPAHTSTH